MAEEKEQRRASDILRAALQDVNEITTSVRSISNGYIVRTSYGSARTEVYCLSRQEVQTFLEKQIPHLVRALPP